MYDVATRRRPAWNGAVLAACLASLVVVPGHVLTANDANAVRAPVPSIPAATQAPTLPRAESVPGEVVVGYVPGANAAERGKARDRVDARLVEPVASGPDSGRRVELLRLPEAASQGQVSRELAADPSVAYVEPNWIYTDQATSSDPYFTKGSLWGMYGKTSNPANRFGSNAAAAWTAGQTGSAKVYVGVIDEGIQVSHPELSRRVRNPGETANGVDDDKNGYVDDVHGWDFVGDNKTVYDGGKLGESDDHGTHVAGTIGAKANGAGVVGVNWKVRMISAKFLGPKGGTLSDAVKAVDYFTDLKLKHGINIVATNNSWGGGGYSLALSEAIERANRAGILFVAAAGNGGSDGSGDNNDATPSYPASYLNDNVIAVAAITKTGGLAGFSNYGAISVDLGAPGTGIWSTTAYKSYGSYSGTSMATPHVTGAAALYAAAHPRASAAAIKDALLNSAVPTESLFLKTVTGARLDIKAALAE